MLPGRCVAVPTDEEDTQRMRTLYGDHVGELLPSAANREQGLAVEFMLNRSVRVAADIGVLHKVSPAVLAVCVP